MEKKQSTLDKAKVMNDILFLGEEFVVLDIETTALSPEKGGMIIELAGVKVKGGKIVDTFTQLINPERKIYQKITELTGITNEMLAGKPVYGQVLPQFFQFLGDAIVVAHNSGFDWDRFLLYFFPKVGIYPTNKVIDTLALAKLYFPNKKKYSLGEMSAELNISLENHHRALDDAKATTEMLLIFKERFATKLYNSSLPLSGEQVDLFNLDDNSDNNVEEVYLNLEVEEAPDTKLKAKSLKEYKIKRVAYWEKSIAKNKTYRRIYVMINGGTVYFDIHNKTWYNKDVKDALDFEALKNSVLKYLKLNTIEELCDYRN